MCDADILNKLIGIAKMPNKYKSLGKQVDLTSSVVIPISTVKRKKEKC